MPDQRVRNIFEKADTIQQDQQTQSGVQNGALPELSFSDLFDRPSLLLSVATRRGGTLLLH